MQQLINELATATTPYCLIQQQESNDILLLTGNLEQLTELKDIPRPSRHPTTTKQFDTISIVPFCQIRERGYPAYDNNEKILCIKTTTKKHITLDKLLHFLPEVPVFLTKDFTFDSTDAEYEECIRNIIDKEIGNGEGANFVIPRNGHGRIAQFTQTIPLSIFKSLLTHDYGTYWKFLFFSGEKFFIGSTPEKHLLVQNGRVEMNPISGTLRKDQLINNNIDFPKKLTSFLEDQKEINELFMVVDEELKMMAKMCREGGTIHGPLLKEMSRLIHSEYILRGKSNKDMFELFSDSMFAATVVGSPVQSACKVLQKYSKDSRRYYGSAMILAGIDRHGQEYLDSPITIRTAEIDMDGTFHLSVGATLVKDSDPKEEVEEVKAKGAALLDALLGRTPPHSPPLLPLMEQDPELQAALSRRNKHLSSFWFHQQHPNTAVDQSTRPKVTLIDNEDDFIYMLQHLLQSMDIETTIVPFSSFDCGTDQADIILMGPGPGNPMDLASAKMQRGRALTRQIIAQDRKALFICLGHQLLCTVLGFPLLRKQAPQQGSQELVELFGKQERVGFYNTFAAIAAENTGPYECSFRPDSREIIAIRSTHFIGYQFHPESILTQNGFSLLKRGVQHLLSDTRL